MRSNRGIQVEEATSGNQRNMVKELHTAVGVGEFRIMSRWVGVDAMRRKKCEESECLRGLQVGTSLCEQIVNKALHTTVVDTV